MKVLSRNVLAVLLIVAAVAISACGSSTGNGSASSSASASGGGSEASNVPSPPTSPPSGIGVSTPLKAAPPSGKTVAWLACALPSCTSFTPGFKAATQALGWNLKVINYQPGKPGPAMQQAVNQGADYIAMTAQPPALFKQELAAAQAKHIPLISANDTTPPAPGIGLMTQFGDQSMFGNESVQMGQWILRDSGNKAHMIYVTIRDYPILEAGFAALKQTVSKYCPTDCSVTSFPITVNDLVSGAVPRKLVSYLQTHPDTNYIDFSFADPLIGVIPALKSAGLASKVKITGQALGAAPQVVSGLKDRSVTSWVAQPNIYQTWLMVDAMARLSVGMPLSHERAAAKEPTWVVDTPSAATGLAQIGGWDGPPGFEGEFKTLWGVG